MGARVLSPRAAERYEIRRQLGGGGAGDVYEAFDRDRNISVALKTLRAVDSGALYRFKREFRALSGLQHRNLVALYELEAHADQVFFTMELVDGADLVSYVRHGERAVAMASALTPELAPTLDTPGAAGASPGGDTVALPILSPEQRARLRDTLTQLATGVRALHQAGKLHRDLKPSNVLVTRSGRVVILDLGLVAELFADEDADHVVGTPAYMSPEQAAGKELTPASDWYSVGTMLYELLTGRLPFRGVPLDVISDKQTEEPPPTAAVASSMPQLAQLCDGLLRRDPADRLYGSAILDAFGAALPGDTADTPAAALRRAPLVGRQEVLATLRDAFDAVTDGPVVALVHGDSGMGKSVIVDHFLAELDDDALVLRGRCYSRESVPFRAFDSLVDDLSRHLRSNLDELDGEALVPLAHMFPVLWRVPAVAAARPATPRQLDGLQLREAGFAGFRELLASLACRRPVVLWIDDLQWGDSDSAALLAELLRPPEAPPLLFIACHRGDESSPVIARLVDDEHALSMPLRRIPITPLNADRAQQLAEALLGQDAADPASASAVARESAGNPYFVAELVRHLRRDPEATADLSLETVLRGRLAALSPPALALLHVVAVAGRPLARTVAARAAGVGADEAAAVVELGNQQLIRDQRVRDRDGVDTFHDRVRQTVIDALAAEELASCHRRLALELDATGDVDAELLAQHFAAAGEPETASRYAARAAERASGLLAFDRAAQLYGLVLELGNYSVDEARAFESRRAEALANAGRGREAAEAYLAMADGTRGDAATDLRRRAADQYVLGGHFDEAVGTLRDVLADIGLELPSSRRAALARVLWQRARLRLRGLRFREREPEQVPARARLELDVCWSASRGLIHVDNLRSIVFHMHHLRRALRAGDPKHIARALVMEAGVLSVFSAKGRRRAKPLLDKAVDMAERHDDSFVRSFAAVGRGVMASYAGDWPTTHREWNRAVDLLRGVRGGLSDRVNWQVWLQLPLLYLGELATLSAHVAELIAAAEMRRDKYTAMSLRMGHANIVWLAGDDPKQARAEVHLANESWGVNSHMIHYATMAHVHIDLYERDGAKAWRRINEMWPRFQQVALLRLQRVRVEALHLRLRAAVAVAATGNTAALDMAARDIKALRREHMPWSSALAAAGEAVALALRGDRDAAIDAARRVERDFDELHMALHAAAVRRWRGTLLGGVEGDALVEAADAWFRNQRVANPSAMTAVFMPGAETLRGTG